MWPYQIIIILLAPVALLHSVWLAIRFREPAYLGQRFAIALPHYVPKTIWLHTASVGEVNASQSLIQALLDRYPNHTILVSTNTITGKHHLRKLFGNNVSHMYMPFDITFCVKLALAKINPLCLMIVETEIWPNLFSCCYKQDIPLLIINGRLSEKTINAHAWLKAAYRAALAYPQKILTRTDTDSERFIQLGAKANSVTTLGNLKYTVIPQQSHTPCSFEQAFILAISTRDNEEQIIVNAWQQAATPAMLAIAPRHPQRKAEILQALSKFNLTIAIRSEGDAVNSETDIYLIDTLGELADFIVQSKFVIIGGSFVEKGGQNLIEAAHANKAIIFGPSMYNFAKETEDFLQHDAAIQARSAAELTQAITDLSQNLARRDTIASNGMEVVASYQHVLDDYMNAIKPVID